MKTALTFLATFLLIISGYSQTVSTFTAGTPDDAIAIDSNGNFYASNFTGDTVFKFDTNGNVSSFVTGLNTPNGLAFDSNDNLYVCDFSASMIFRYDSSGNLDDSISIPGNPSGIIKAFDNDDMIYTRYTSNTINRITPAGVITEISSAPELDGPVGLAYDEFGELYVGNYNNREIYHVLANGDLGYIATLPASGSTPNLGFITYAQGRIFGTILGDHKIYSVDPAGVDSYLLFAGSTQGGMDGDISQATFNRPNGILANAAGDVLYVTDFGSKNFRIISDVVLAVGDNSIEENRITVYPNPTRIFVNIEGYLENSEAIMIKIYDVTGKNIFSRFLEMTSPKFLERVNTEAWTSGVYLLTITTNNTVFTRRIVK